MPGTRVHQVRSATSTDQGAVYTITVSCTLSGTLPDTAIFLLKVVTPNDPKDDSIERICSPADFDTYGTDRDQAALSSDLYRSSRYTYRYTSVLEANAAWQTLSSYINTLVNDYDVYMTAFVTRDEGVDMVYPTVDESEKNSRIVAYQARVADVTAAEAARNEHQRTCRDPKALALTTTQAQLAQAQSDLAALSPVRTVTDTLAASYPSAQTTINAALTAALTATNTSSATPTQQLTISTQILNAQRANDAIAGYDTRLIAEVQTPLAAFVATLTSRVADLTQGVSSAQSELAACDSEMSRLQGDVDEARRARDAALAAVREVCTDFVPSQGVDGALAASIGLLLGGAG